MFENFAHAQKMNSKKNYDEEKNESADDIEEKYEQNDKIAPFFLSDYINKKESNFLIYKF